MNTAPREKKRINIFKWFKNRYIGNWPFYVLILTIMIPVVTQSFLETAINLVDNAFANNAGSDGAAVGGIGIANQIFFIFLLTTIGVASGFGVYTSQFFGAKREKQLQEIVRIKIIVAIVMAIIFVLIIELFGRELVTFLTGAEPDTNNSSRLNIINTGTEYIRIVAISYPLAAVSIALSFTFQQTKRVKWPILVTLLSLIINAGLDAVFVFGNTNISPVQGIALGTIIARAVEILAFIVILYFTKYEFSREIWKLWKTTRKLWVRALITAGPFIINEILWSTAITARFVFYGERSTDALLALIVSSTINDFAFVIFSGIAISVSIVVGNSLGKNLLKEAEANTKKLLFFSFVLAILVGIFIFGCSFWVPGVFFSNNPPGSQIIATYFTASLAVAFPFITLVAAMQFVVKAGGDSVGVFLSDGLLQWVGPTLLAFLLVTFAQNLDIIIINILFQSFVVVKMGIASIFYFRKKWVKNLAKSEKEWGPV